MRAKIQTRAIEAKCPMKSRQRNNYFRASDGGRVRWHDDIERNVLIVWPTVGMSPASARAISSHVGFVDALGY